MTTADQRFRLEYNGQFLELSARRDGLRTQVALFVDGDQGGRGIWSRPRRDTFAGRQVRRGRFDRGLSCRAG